MRKIILALALIVAVSIVPFVFATTYVGQNGNWSNEAATWVNCTGTWVHTSGNYTTSHGTWSNSSGTWINSTGDWIESSGDGQFPQYFVESTIQGYLLWLSSVLDNTVLSAIYTPDYSSAVFAHAVSGFNTSSQASFNSYVDVVKSFFGANTSTNYSIGGNNVTQMVAASGDQLYVWFSSNGKGYVAQGSSSNAANVTLAYLNKFGMTIGTVN